MCTNQTSVPTGIPGLDEILRGGLPPNHVYLLEGDPGAGKTTLGIQFLLEGIRRGEKVLYLTLLHQKQTLDEMAASHGWDLTGVEAVSLILASEAESRVAEQTLLPSSEVQLTNVMDAIKEAIDRVMPTRMFFDSISQLRLLAGDEMIYRQKILAMLWRLEEHKVTAIFSDTSHENLEFKTLAHGSITLDARMRDYGEMHRRLHVEKLRTVPFVEGYHSFQILTGGIEVYPRSSLLSRVVQPEWSFALSGINALDTMLGGGLSFGTSCLIAGQAGMGKTSLATTFAYAAAKRGECSSIFLFDERIDIFLKRTQGMRMDILPLMEQNLIKLQRVDIGDMSAGEFAHRIREEVERHNVRVVVIDSLTGLINAMPDEPQLLGQLHNMLAFLGQHGVLTLITATEHGIVGTKGSSVDASFIADTMVLIRRFEAMGSIRLALSVIKKRNGNHEKSIRELQITSQGLVVGQPLTEFQGVLTGEPTFVGESRTLMESKHA